MGYDAVFRTDIGSDDLRSILHDFAEKSAKADVSIVYYAGYAVTAKGETYLIPVDIGVAGQGVSGNDAISLRAVTRAVVGARSLGLVVLDARRESVFERMFEQYEGKAFQTAAPSMPARGATLFFSAQLGKEVEEGNGRNSPFATAIMKSSSGRNLRSVSFSETFGMT